MEAVLLDESDIPDIARWYNNSIRAGRRYVPTYRRLQLDHSDLLDKVHKLYYTHYKETRFLAGEIWRRTKP